MMVAGASAPAVFAQRPLRYEVRHRRWLWDRSGTLAIDERGLSFQETSKNKKKNPKRPCRLDLSYQDVQQLSISPKTLTVLTYRDQMWKLGVDKGYQFTLPKGGETFVAAYVFLKKHLDERLVAELADDDVKPLWEIPVKRLGTLKGSEGALLVGPERIVYRTERLGQSRTWRLPDIESISSSGRFQLTLTTHERARAHYESMKEFHFQLKQPLDDKRFEALWRQVNRSKELPFLNSLEKSEEEK